MPARESIRRLGIWAGLLAFTAVGCAPDKVETGPEFAAGERPGQYMPPPPPAPDLSVLSDQTAVKLVEEQEITYDPLPRPDARTNHDQATPDERAAPAPDEEAVADDDTDGADADTPNLSARTEDRKSAERDANRAPRPKGGHIRSSLMGLVRRLPGQRGRRPSADRPGSAAAADRPSAPSAEEMAEDEDEEAGGWDADEEATAKPPLNESPPSEDRDDKPEQGDDNRASGKRPDRGPAVVDAREANEEIPQHPTGQGRERIDAVRAAALTDAGTRLIEFVLGLPLDEGRTVGQTIGKETPDQFEGFLVGLYVAEARWADPDTLELDVQITLEQLISELSGKFPEVSFDGLKRFGPGKAVSATGRAKLSTTPVPGKRRPGGMNSGN